MSYPVDVPKNWLNACQFYSVNFCGNHSTVSYTYVFTRSSDQFGLAVSGNALSARKQTLPSSRECRKVYVSAPPFAFRRVVEYSTKEPTPIYRPARSPPYVAPQISLETAKKRGSSETFERPTPRRATARGLGACIIQW